MVKRILFVTSNTCIGGVETILLNYIRAIDRRKYHVTVIATEIKGQLDKEYRDAADEMIFLNNNESIRMWLTSHPYDITHVYNSIHAIEMIKDLPGIKVISTFGDFGQPYAWFRIRKEAFIANMPHIDYMTTDNLTGLSVFDHFPYYVTNAVAVSEDKEAPEKEPKSVVWIGRDSGEKRINILANVVQRMPDTHFYCAVAQLAPPSTDFERLKKFQNVTISVNASYKEIMGMCRRSKVFLSTSMTEGTPVSMIEAISCGCSPVVSNVGGMPGVVQYLAISGAPTGRIVMLEQNDYERHITDSIASYHPILAQRQMEIIQDTYSVDRYVKTFDLIYSEELPRRPKSEAIMRIAKSHKVLPMDERALALARQEPWNIETNIEFARKLYLALFDVEIDSSPFWSKIVRDGYPRKNIVIHMFKALKQTSPRLDAVRSRITMEVMKRSPYRDDKEGPFTGGL